MNYKIQRHHVLLFILVSFAVILFFYQGELGAISKALLAIQPQYLLMAFGCILLFWLFESGTLLLMLRTFEPELSFSEVLKLVIATQFFNGITPFSTGGQPFQIYILSKKKSIDISSVTSASLHNFVVYQLVLVLMGSGALMISNVMNLVPSSPQINWMVGLGFGLNMAVVIGLLVVAFSPAITEAVMKPVFALLGHFQTKDKYESFRDTCLRKTADFHTRIQEVMGNPGLFMKALLLNVMKLVSLYSVTYFLSLALGIGGLSLFKAIIISAYVMLITSMVPVPGASGGAEIGFAVLFSAALGAQMTAVMLLWRLLTYYVGLVVGSLVYYFGYATE